MVPVDLSWPVAAGCLAAIGVAGMLRGFTGFGFGLAATPLLALILSPTMVVPLVLMLQVGSSFIGIRRSIERHDRRSTRWLTLSAIATTPLGVWLLHDITVAQARLCIAAATLGAVIVLGSGLRCHREHGAGFILPFGLLAGVLAGLCAIPGPPVLAYYLGTDTPPPIARASMILIFMATGTLALATSIVTGTFDPHILWLALLAAPVMFGGTALGEMLFEHASPGLYRPVGIASLAAIAASSGLRALVH